MPPTHASDPLVRLAAAAAAAAELPATAPPPRGGPRRSVRVDPVSGQRYLSVPVTGRALLEDPLTNKGTAFTREERSALHLDGVLPPAISTLDQQLARTYENFLAAPTPIARYIHLAALHDRNEVLFFRLLHEHIEEMLPIVYTPTVGEACERFSHLYRRPRGLYVSWEQRGRLVDVLRNSAAFDPSIIVVTDGERILGLGDQGAGGMGIPIGKLCLYTLCAGIPPETTLPIMLDVGTENEQALADPLYLGVRQRRVRGDAYQAFVDEFVAAVRTVFPRAVLQWEDFLKENALVQLERFRDQLTSFNDDIQGTAAVTVAGMLASLRLTGGKLSEQRLLLAGAGASAQGIAQLFVAALVESGIPEPVAHRQVSMTDRGGLVVRDRPGLEGFKLAFARDPEELAGWHVRDREHITLAELVHNIRPTLLVGTSTTPGLFDEQVVRAMAQHNARPVIFPLSNPTRKAECTPADALRWSDGRAIVATGSPFDAVEHGGRMLRIGQCNNTFIFPGVGLGAWVGKVRRISDAMFLDAARALAEFVSADDLAHGSVFPRIDRIRAASLHVACAVLRRAIREGSATDPRFHAGNGLDGLNGPDGLDGLEERVRAAMWSPEYLPLRHEAAD
jgi:malate dehydrogenase (oxaloacetate-decarboxylating)